MLVFEMPNKFSTWAPEMDVDGRHMLESPENLCWLRTQRYKEN